ncbi:hypothetical protein niasHT_035409 [Heterodera trifolii]|uniref:Uncharacterized protein n=1 Tax=Heterodera trifolii TaxID=157864 RepID=A0ABD2IAF1_9BILA
MPFRFSQNPPKSHANECFPPFPSPDGPSIKLTNFNHFEMSCPSLFVLCLSSLSVFSVVLASSVLKGRSDFVQICVLFEALCPDSVRFLLGPLSDAHDEFGQRIRLELVPFGKATVNEQNGAIVCQHGKFECQINKFLVLIIAYQSLINELLGTDQQQSEASYFSTEIPNSA